MRLANDDIREPTPSARFIFHDVRLQTGRSATPLSLATDSDTNFQRYCHDGIISCEGLISCRLMTSGLISGLR
ncbi:hypothetical protein HK28_09255 [Acetobacter sp. DsW_063]|nr:hypothetical protein HK28_09255 [Acetobacter sp. DsW_063]